VERIQNRTAQFKYQGIEKNVTLWLTEGKTKKNIHKYIRTNQNHIYNQLLGICGVQEWALFDKDG
jgi:hypothetical protein